MRNFIRMGLIALAFITSGCDLNEISYLKMGLGFEAKELCSCLFVVGQTEAFCRDYVKVDEINPKLEIDYTKKETSAHYAGIFVERAQWHDEDSGCKIVH